MLEIKDLHARVGGKDILRGLTLSIGAGQVHAIMGPNGSGKSTLSYVLAGRDGYEITCGQVLFKGQDIATLAPEQRAALGLFLGFQYPVEIPGVTMMTFLRTAVNALAKVRGGKELDAAAFLRKIKGAAEKLKISDEMLKRAVNVGYSGGEKKRAEVLQMTLLEPTMAVLDETDSGLDIDALKLVADGVNALRGADRAFLVITHYQRLLDYIVPDHVHILAHGRIQTSGGPELAKELEKSGYEKFVKAA
jgi:Fe-S cluster assembly ATP-binding protein